MLRDPAFWLPLAAGASSRNLGQAFLRFSVRFYLIRMIRLGSVLQYSTLLSRMAEIRVKGAIFSRVRVTEILSEKMSAPRDARENL